MLAVLGKIPGKVFFRSIIEYCTTPEIPRWCNGATFSELPISSGNSACWSETPPCVRGLSDRPPSFFAGHPKEHQQRPCQAICYGSISLKPNIEIHVIGIVMEIF